MSEAGVSQSAKVVPGRRRVPAIPVVFAFAVGIVADTLTCWSGWVWLSLAFVFLLTSLALIQCRAFWLASASTLLTVATAGAVRHHEAWSVASANDIGLFATETSQPVRLIGKITRRPQFMSAPHEESRSMAAWRTRPERIVFAVCCRYLRDGADWIPVSGSVRVDVAGTAAMLELGDEVELFGRLTKPDEPRNVGEFDFRKFLREQGIRAVVRCRTSDAVRRLQRPEDIVSRFRRQLAKTREHCETLLRNNLSTDAASVAVALLLGSRTRMSQQQREAFVESGTMHVLAISGLNVAILAMFVGGVCRWLNVSRTLTGAAILILVGGYAAITDAGPPVVRASLLVFLAALGWPLDRPMHGSNLLAVTALGVLLWNPTDLFNAGAQLSFLAVAVILWYLSRPHAVDDLSSSDSAADGSHKPEPTPSELEKELATRLPMTWPRKTLLGGWSIVRESTIVSCLISMFTAPLIMERFHLISPVGVLANIPLLPVASATLCVGYCMLLFGFISAWLAGQIAVLFEWSLRTMLFIVDVAGEFCCGHHYVPTPPQWWSLGMAALLASLFWQRRPLLNFHRGWKALWLWVTIGLLAPFWPERPQPLRCTVLSVGHGLAVLIETPSGHTVLYDAGTIGEPRRATEVVQQALWHRGHSRLDGIVLSHADSDHVNGVPGLLRTIPVGGLFVSPQFLDRRQPAVKEMLDTADECKVPVQLLWESDSLPLDDSLRCRVLRPSATSVHSSDNASSVVLVIEFRGRRLLLTGDLEREGLQHLLKTPPLRADVLLAPHHGSQTANTPDLARWAAPRWLVVSGDRRVNRTLLQERFGSGTVVLNTAVDGAITFEIGLDGRLSCQSFRRGRLADE